MRICDTAILRISCVHGQCLSCNLSKSSARPFRFEIFVSSLIFFCFFLCLNCCFLVLFSLLKRCAFWAHDLNVSIHLQMKCLAFYWIFVQSRKIFFWRNKKRYCRCALIAVQLIFTFSSCIEIFLSIYSYSDFFAKSFTKQKIYSRRLIAIYSFIALDSFVFFFSFLFLLTRVLCVQCFISSGSFLWWWVIHYRNVFWMRLWMMYNLSQIISE